MENFSIIFTLIGAYIGAGFISGKEIIIYFYQYGLGGVIGIILSSLFIGFVIFNVIKICQDKSINNYEMFFDTIIKNKLVKSAFNMYFQVSFCVMISGFCGFIDQELRINKYIPYFVFLLIIFFTLKRKANKILKINSYLIPIIVGFICYIFCITQNVWINDEIYSSTRGFLLSMFIYANYNLISLIPIIVTNSKRIKNRFFVSFIFSNSIIWLSLMLFGVFMSVDNNLLCLNFPVIGILDNYGNVYKLIYCMVLGISIYSTAISLAHNFYQNNKKNIEVIFISFILLHVSFSKIIESIYPIFGLCSIYQCWAIIRYLHKQKKKIKKT